MITADEARERTKLSEKYLTSLIEDIGKQIETAADEGKRQLFVYNPGFWNSVPKFSSLEATPRQLIIIERLKNAGFHAELKAHGNTYTPSGLPTNQEYVNHVISVHW
jgi:tRNA G26 N,N-dimethylase Trm1